MEKRKRFLMIALALFLSAVLNRVKPFSGSSFVYFFTLYAVLSLMLSGPRRKENRRIKNDFTDG